MKLAIIFILLSIVNVVFSTWRSIVTIKGNKYLASVVSAGYFAFYNIVLIYTMTDFPMWEKCLITFGCNLIGVFVVKYIEEKKRKDRLWKIETTFLAADSTYIIQFATKHNLYYNYHLLGKHINFNFYVSNKEETKLVKTLVNIYNGKYFASETKYL